MPDVTREECMRTDYGRDYPPVRAMHCRPVTNSVVGLEESWGSMKRT